MNWMDLFKYIRISKGLGLKLRLNLLTFLKSKIICCGSKILMQVVWYKEEEAIKESERIELKFEGDHCSLKVKNTGMSDAGLYTIKATNTVGEATNFCRLTVQSPSTPRSSMIPPSTSSERKFSLITPSFAPPLTNQVVREGARTIFEVCEFSLLFQILKFKKVKIKKS